ncbi:NACHT domain-containing protein [Streptomyces sp. NPDC051636]|uniref:NACHT domain-containing protein n=1 Tax=Streptomyces sp. NPDC051636 TaxID=3365663 RepID=UPI00379A4140
MVGRRGADGVRWRTVVLVLGLTALAGLLVWVGVAGIRRDLAAAGVVAGIVAALLAAPMLAVGLWTWWRRTTGPQLAATGEEINRAKEMLAGLVAEQWRDEAVLRSLDDPIPIPVHWRVARRPDLMDHPANLTPGVLISVSSNEISGLVGEFRRMERRRLVVLGGPGAGKTTLAVQMVRELLASRERHGDEPVPVLFSAAGWDTGRHPRLREWISDRLATGYPALRAPGLGSDMAAVLARRGHILPILDGLDELPPPAQAEVIAALNRSLAETDQLILTSRTAEFCHALQQAGDVLTSALVLEPDPLRPTVAADYLERCLPPRPAPAWERILQDLRAPVPAHSVAALADLAATPLGLWLLRTVYVTPGADPAPLLDPDHFRDSPALRAHLLDHLVGSLITTRPPGEHPTEVFRPSTRHDPDQVRRWLGFLAHYLDTRGTRDFAWWQLARNTDALTPTTRVAFGALTALAFAVLIVLLTGLIGVGASMEGLIFEDGLSAVVFAGVPIGISVGLLVGPAAAVAAGAWAREEPGFLNLRLHSPLAMLLRRFTVEIAWGFALASALGFTIAFVTELADYLLDGSTSTGERFDDNLVLGGTVGLWAGPVVGIARGVVSWAETPTPEERASTPPVNWRADRALNLLRAGTSGIAVGVPTGVLFGTEYSGIPYEGAFEERLWVGLMFALVLGSVSGFVNGLVLGKHRAWFAYLAATRRLAERGQLPRRLMAFLDDAHRLGLLRAVGPIYQFRHAEFQDHLAAGYAGQASPAAAGDNAGVPPAPVP